MPAQMFVKTFGKVWILLVYWMMTCGACQLVIICELAARGCLVLTLSKQSIKFDDFVLFIRIVLFYNIPLTEQDPMLIIYVKHVLWILEP